MLERDLPMPTERPPKWREVEPNESLSPIPSIATRGKARAGMAVSGDEARGRLLEDGGRSSSVPGKRGSRGRVEKSSGAATTRTGHSQLAFFLYLAVAVTAVDSSTLAHCSSES